MFGSRQRFSSATYSTIATTGTNYQIKRCSGAIAVLVRISGGNSANAVTPTAEGVDAGGTAAGSQGVPLTVDKPATLVSNKVLPEGDYFVINYDRSAGYTGQLPFPAPEVAMVLTAATSNITGCVVDAWPIFPSQDAFINSSGPLDAGGTAL